MYAKNFGRFSSPDPLLNSGRPNAPQTWNKYAYSANSPLRFNDKTGLFEWDESLRDDETLTKKERERRTGLRKKILAAYDKARAEIDKAIAAKKLSAEKLAKLNNALNSLGPKPGESGSDNGVTIGVGNLSKPTAVGQTDAEFTYNQSNSDSTKDNVSAAISVTFTENYANSGNLFAGLVHEGSHVADLQAYAGHRPFFGAANTARLTDYQTEYNAFEVNSYLFEAMGKNGSDYDIPVWNNNWAKVDKKLPPLEDSRKTAINSFVSTAYNGLSASSPGQDFSSFGYKVTRKP